ncbi:RNA-binding domain-containing protein [Neocallimastix lanati (nom. inval.)]|jgi:RNA-binding protein 8A|uniref:RNA-binding domain-containing protein n=1 Tax=Neocallimastix californiae TaxID=1754190 RepID=A0A1Y2AF41_9FUNG|nr:RNA-binding domain-containing protein [Neocallimastix sp. JGI-2020a]ORY21199.1 RNA-binding domain-containing protein [Neocallimastix californiae]|eukprot:ORY21199.1 RNA-binding domain-containing protein [Neocallimastix californiae]
MADTYELDLEPGADDFAEDEMMIDNETVKVKSHATKRKGRGFNDHEDRDEFMKEKFDTVDTDTAGNAQRSVEGWVIIVTGIHKEATEDVVEEKFADFGEIQNITLNVDRRTGYIKGYALLEFKTYKEAKEAIDECDNTDLLGQTIHCDFAFVKGSNSSKSRDSRQVRRGRDRSKSPRRR